MAESSESECREEVGGGGEMVGAGVLLPVERPACEIRYHGKSRGGRMTAALLVMTTVKNGRTVGRSCHSFVHWHLLRSPLLPLPPPPPLLLLLLLHAHAAFPGSLPVSV